MASLVAWQRLKPSQAQSNFRAVVCACLLAAVAGCEESESSMVAVTGKMTVDGRPLSGAIVTLEPIGATTGPNASGLVIGGQFAIDPSAGLHGGRYRVRVSMLPMEVRDKIPPEANFALPPANAVIDPAFDANSRLSCELTTNKRNELNFAVEFLD